MENSTDKQDQGIPPFQMVTPNATAVLVLGILSIVFCWCLGIPGLTMGIIALVLARNGEKEYYANPGKYTESSFKNLDAGKICAIIGTALSGIYILLVVIKLIFFGAVMGNMFHIPWDQIK